MIYIENFGLSLWLIVIGDYGVRFFIFLDDYIYTIVKIDNVLFEVGNIFVL